MPFLRICPPSTSVRLLTLTLSVLFVFAFTSPCLCAADSQERFETLMAEARACDPNFSLGSPKVNRDRAVELYWQAIEARGPHPGNIDIEFRTGELLAYIVDPPNNQGTRRDDALGIFEGIMERYPKSHILTVRSSILAGDLRFGERDTAREHYAYAMAGLAEAYRCRKSQSKNPNADDFDLFSHRDRPLFTAAARQYLRTFAPRGSPERLPLYDKMAEEYPGTPFERIARKNKAALLEKLAEDAQAQGEALAHDLHAFPIEGAEVDLALESAPPEEPSPEPPNLRSQPPAEAPRQADETPPERSSWRSAAYVAVFAVLVVLICLLLFRRMRR